MYYQFLNSINSPQDLKRLEEREVEALAKEIRHFLVASVAKTGGHLASNLGVVELTLALHTIYDTTKDRIVWDVGHQTYVHKILTGRRDDFHTLRQYKGISGFPKRKESIHDHFDTGHSSTSISAAMGMAAVRDLKKEKHHVVAVIGDGALTGGMALEALNHAGQTKQNMLVVLNDNEMSIAENVGGLSQYLSKIRTAPFYSKVKGDVEALIGNIPAIGKSMVKTVERAKDSIKYFFVPGVLFEEFGFTYIGPVDGHNYGALCKALKQCQNLNGPVLLHVLTKKGKGYELAEKSPENFHGVSPFKVDSGKPLKSSKAISYSELAGKTLIECAKADERVVAITAAMPAGTGLTAFAQAFPNRFFDVGIAEQHAVTFGAGIAAAGYKPFIPLYSTFLQRGFDQVLHDVCLQKLPVTLLIDRAGLVGNDGETHHGVFDISFLSCIPNITLMAPINGAELRAMIHYALNAQGPVAIRYPRGADTVPVEEPPHQIVYGKGEVLYEGGTDGLIIPVGNMVPVGLEVCHRLKELGIHMTLINPRFIKPLDEALILQYAQKCKGVYTIEDHVKVGGFGSLVLSLLNDHHYSHPVRSFALPDTFVEHGSIAELHHDYGLSSEKIAEAISSEIIHMDRNKKVVYR